MNYYILNDILETIEYIKDKKMSINVTRSAMHHMRNIEKNTTLWIKEV